MHSTFSFPLAMVAFLACEVLAPNAVEGGVGNCTGHTEAGTEDIVEVTLKQPHLPGIALQFPAAFVRGGHPPSSKIRVVGGERQSVRIKARYPEMVPLDEPLYPSSGSVIEVQMVRSDESVLNSLRKINTSISLATGKFYEGLDVRTYRRAPQFDEDGPFILLGDRQRGSGSDLVIECSVRKHVLDICSLSTFYNGIYVVARGRRSVILDWRTITERVTELVRTFVTEEKRCP